jgi:hypothetical protein
MTAEQAGFHKPRYGAFECMQEKLDAKPEHFLYGYFKATSLDEVNTMLGI